MVFLSFLHSTPTPTKRQKYEELRHCIIWDYNTEDDIVTVIYEKILEKELVNESMNRILHFEGFKAIEAALKNFSQQEEAMPADFIRLGNGKDLSASKHILWKKQNQSKTILRLNFANLCFFLFVNFY